MLGLSVETHHTVEIKIAEGSLRRIQSSCQKTMLMVITNRLHLIFLLSHFISAFPVCDHLSLYSICLLSH